MSQRGDGTGWKLWIDDQAYDPETPERHAPEDYFVATSSDEACRITAIMGRAPMHLHLDHDLGGDDKVITYLKWLSDRHISTPPTYEVHSQNPVGRKNIESFMNSWWRSLDL